MTIEQKFRDNSVEVICEACLPYICAYWETPPGERIETCPQLKKWVDRLYSTVIDGKCLAIVDLEGLSAESSIKPETPKDYIVERRTSRLLLKSTIEDIYKAGQLRMKHQIESTLSLADYTHPIVALLGEIKKEENNENEKV